MSGQARAPRIHRRPLPRHLPIPPRPDAPALVQQGVTTTITGNCGFSPFPSPTDERPLTGSFLNPALDRSWRDCACSPITSDRSAWQSMSPTRGPQRDPCHRRRTGSRPGRFSRSGADSRTHRRRAGHGGSVSASDLPTRLRVDAQLDELRVVAARSPWRARC